MFSHKRLDLKFDCKVVQSIFIEIKFTFQFPSVRMLLSGNDIPNQMNTSSSCTILEKQIPRDVRTVKITIVKNFTEKD